MYGDEAERKTPVAVRRLLRDYGGLTPHGWPMWRLVRAGDCTIVCQGRVHHFPRGVKLDINVKPTRISGGVARMPRYADINPDWWILQKWFSPRVWGSPFEWLSHRSEDSLRMMVQEFPENGDYFMLAGPWPSVEAAGDLRQPITLFLRRELHKRRDAEGFVKQMMAQELHERQERFEWLEREITRAEASLNPILKSVGSGAQKVRDSIAARAGISGHLGASEAWG